MALKGPTMNRKALCLSAVVRRLSSANFQRQRFSNKVLFMSLFLMTQVLDYEIDAEKKVKLLKLADNGDVDGMNKLGFFPKLEPEHHPINVIHPIRELVYKRDNYACKFCGTTEDLTLDHIVPFSKGGDSTPDNLQTLCRSCNSRKGAR